MVADQIKDITQAYRIAFWIGDSDDIKRANFLSDTLPELLEICEKYLERANTQFAAGDELTYADLSISVIIERFRENVSNHLERFPRLKRIDDFVNANPNIVAWRAKRPVTSY